MTASHQWETWTVTASQVRQLHEWNNKLEYWTLCNKARQRHLPQSPPELMFGARKLRCKRLTTVSKIVSKGTPTWTMTDSAYQRDVYHKSRCS